MNLYWTYFTIRKNTEITFQLKNEKLESNLCSLFILFTYEK